MGATAVSPFLGMSANINKVVVGMTAMMRPSYLMLKQNIPQNLILPGRWLGDAECTTTECMALKCTIVITSPLCPFLNWQMVNFGNDVLCACKNGWLSWQLDDSQQQPRLVASTEPQS